MLFAAASVARPNPLRVGVAGSPPFVVDDDERLSGAAVEIRRSVAAELALEFELVQFANVDQLVQATSTGSVAVGIGPISVGSNRAALIDFTQPYYEAQFALLSREDSSSAERMILFLSRALLVATGTLLLLLFGAGNLFWLVERRANAEQFPGNYRRGIAEGMWLAMVTMSTVGYGDRYPRTGLGRLLAGGWMLFSMVAASSLTAGIAAALTSRPWSRGRSS